jgi:hypothetical protein
MRRRHRFLGCLSLRSINAEALPVEPERPSLILHDFWEGSAAVERLFLDEDHGRAIISNEIDKRQHAADEFDRLGKTDRAERLRMELAIARRCLASQGFRSLNP